MKNIWLNILAFVAFLVIGGIYTVLLGRDIVSIRR